MGSAVQNETHNHPTEIEPFGWSRLGYRWAIRDPLSGRSYVYAAMRATGARNPLTPECHKDSRRKALPRQQLHQDTAHTETRLDSRLVSWMGSVSRRYVAREWKLVRWLRLLQQRISGERGQARRRYHPAGAAELVETESGGATGSSKSHSTESQGAEVQKGSAPEEKDRTVRNPEATTLIKRCNDFRCRWSFSCYRRASEMD